MQSRQEHLLKHLVKLYIRSADPISSSALVGMDDELDVSSATIRNEMAFLEEEGYVSQPHTSAGRIPTEKGYRFYVDNFLEARTLLEEVEKRFQEAATITDVELGVKRVAKALAELTHEAVIVSFDEDDIYYTGLAYLLSQPEFRTPEQVAYVSQLLDQCEQVMSEISNIVASDETQILIGQENPFGESCALVVSPFQHGFMGVLGPTRMDYEYTLTLMNRATQLLNSMHF